MLRSCPAVEGIPAPAPAIAIIPPPELLSSSNAPSDSMGLAKPLGGAMLELRGTDVIVQ